MWVNLSFASQAHPREFLELCGEEAQTQVSAELQQRLISPMSSFLHGGLYDSDYPRAYRSNEPAYTYGVNSEISTPADFGLSLHTCDQITREDSLAMHRLQSGDDDGFPPIEDVNFVPAGYEWALTEISPNTLDLSCFLPLLRFYVEKQCLRSGGTPLPWSDSQLVNAAELLGLWPLAVRLHLENTGQLPVPQEHSQFLARLSRDPSECIDDDLVPTEDNTPSRGMLNDCSDDRVNCGDEFGTNAPSLEYYPGIELKLGKQRDTIIRPMITFAFRSNREGFRSALLNAGLRYSELRTWKDFQLCTALHVADSFVAGIWEKAVNIHISKTTGKQRGQAQSSRKRKSLR